MDTPLAADAFDPWASQEQLASVDWEPALANAHAGLKPGDKRSQILLQVTERAVALLASEPGVKSLTLALSLSSDNPSGKIEGWADTDHGIVEVGSVGSHERTERALERAAKDVERLLRELLPSARRALLSEVFQTPLTLENAGRRLKFSHQGLEASVDPEPAVQRGATPRP